MAGIIEKKRKDPRNRHPAHLCSGNRGDKRKNRGRDPHINRTKGRYDRVEDGLVFRGNG